MKKTIIFLIKIYQVTISPLLGSNCRFQPTCSQYTIEAITKAWRLFRNYIRNKKNFKMSSMGERGFDPVPERKD